MALSLLLNEDSIGLTKDGSTIYITDKTGLYNAVTNTGGWGSPNVNLNQSALMVVVEKYVSNNDNIFLTTVGSQIVYDNTASNSKETQFSFALGADGYHKIYLIRLPVSTNGSATLEGTALTAGNYFYMNNIVQQKTATGSTTVSDYSVLVDDTNANAPSQYLYEHLVMADIAVALNTQYKAYKLERDTYAQQEDTERKKMIDFFMDQVGAQWAFDAGDETVAEDIVESLINDYVG